MRPMSMCRAACSRPVPRPGRHWTQVEGGSLMEQRQFAAQERERPTGWRNRGCASAGPMHRSRTCCIGATVDVSAEAKGPLGEVLSALVNGSPLGEMTGHALKQASASGSADLQLKPAAGDGWEQDRCAGQDHAGRQTICRLRRTPCPSRTRGVVHFSEAGLPSAAARRALGGELRAEGGTIPVPGAATRSGQPCCACRAMRLPRPAPGA